MRWRTVGGRSLKTRARRWQPLTSERLDLASRAGTHITAQLPRLGSAFSTRIFPGVLGLRLNDPAFLRITCCHKRVSAPGESALLALDQVERGEFLNGSSAVTPRCEPRPTLGYWEAGQRIVSLSRCNLPIIIGIEEESFSVDLHADEARFAAFGARSWSLSTIGQSIVEGRDDLTKMFLGRSITARQYAHLTPDRLWRWDATNEALIEPK